MATDPAAPQPESAAEFALRVCPASPSKVAAAVAARDAAVEAAALERAAEAAASIRKAPMADWLLLRAAAIRAAARGARGEA